MKTTIPSLAFAALLFGFLSTSCKKSSSNPSTLNTDNKSIETDNLAADVQQASKDFVNATKGDISTDSILSSAALDAANTPVDANHPLNSADAADQVGGQIVAGANDLNKDAAVHVLNDGPITSCPAKAALAEAAGKSGQSGECQGGEDAGYRNAAIALGVIGGLVLLGVVGHFLHKSYYSWDSSAERNRAAQTDASKVTLVEQKVEVSAKLGNTLSPEKIIAETQSLKTTLEFSSQPLSAQEAVAVEKLVKGEVLTLDEAKTIEEIVSKQKSAFEAGQEKLKESEFKALTLEPGFPSKEAFVEFDRARTAKGANLMAVDIPPSIIDFLGLDKSAPVGEFAINKIDAMAKVLAAQADLVTQDLITKLERLGGGRNQFDTYRRLKVDIPSEFKNMPELNEVIREKRDGFIKLAGLNEIVRAKVIEIRQTSDASTHDAALKRIDKLKELGFLVNEVTGGFFSGPPLYGKLEGHPAEVLTLLEKERLNLVVNDRTSSKMQDLRFNAKAALAKAIGTWVVQSGDANNEVSEKLQNQLTETEKSVAKNAIDAEKTRVEKIANPASSEGKAQIAEARAESLERVRSSSGSSRLAGIGGLIGMVLVFAAIGVATSHQETSLANDSDPYAHMKTFEEKASYYKFKVLPAICKKHFPQYCSNK